MRAELTRRWTRDERTAVHEAGHAVIGRVLRLKCGRASIEPDYDDSSWGRTIIYPPDETLAYWWDECGLLRREHRSAVLGWMLVQMAGREAEVVLTGRHDRGDGAFKLWDSDQNRLVRMAIDEMAHGVEVTASGAELGPAWKRYERRLRRQTRRLVRRHRESIEIVAKALLTNRTMTADQIDALLT